MILSASLFVDGFMTGLRMDLGTDLDLDLDLDVVSRSWISVLPDVVISAAGDTELLVVSEPWSSDAAIQFLLQS